MLNVRRARALVLVVAATACRQLAGLDDPQPWDGGGETDADADAGDGDGPMASSCYGTGVVQLCLDVPAAGAITLPGGTLDTDTSSLCAGNVTSGASGACVIAGHTVELPVGTTLSATGAKPLIIIAHDTITISGTLSVASRLRGARGAGSTLGPCDAPGSPPSGGGGAGGSFGGRGGSGGAATPTPAGAPLVPTSLRGGCGGQDGSGASSAGAGGGATFLIAKAAIDVMGSINASGAGAENADSGVRGGSGGGSGGMLGLDAPVLQIGGAVFANGGGGSSGSDTTSEGDDGGDPSADSGGPGGTGGAADGGDGAAGATLTGAAGEAGVAGSTGGGGGGGGAGIVKLYGSRTGAGTISPPPT